MSSKNKNRTINQTKQSNEINKTSEKSAFEWTDVSVA